MEIINAKTAGFCFGVRRAVKLAREAAEKYGRCACLGPLIHNADVVRELEALGVRTVNGISELEPGEPVLIRSHGVGKDVYAQLEELRCPVIDATCPEVARIHELAMREEAQGRKVLIIGQRDHPEITALAGWCRDAAVLQSPSEAEKYLEEHPELAEAPVSVVSQTTGERKNFEDSVNFIKKQCTNAKIFDTICNTTSYRQREASEIASRVPIPRSSPRSRRGHAPVFSSSKTPGSWT